MRSSRAAVSMMDFMALSVESSDDPELLTNMMGCTDVVRGRLKGCN